MRMVDIAIAIVVGAQIAGCGSDAPTPENSKSADRSAELDHVNVGSDTPYGIYLGQFEVKSGEVIVSDPCYDVPKPGEEGVINGVLGEVLEGKWNAYVKKINAGEWGTRCSELTAYQADQELPHGGSWIEVPFVVGVDSGQAGVFEKQDFNDASLVPKDYFRGKTPIDANLWYSMCCDFTLSDLGAGAFSGGAVSSSGYGDGVYECYYKLGDDGKKIGIRIVFLSEDDIK